MKKRFLVVASAALLAVSACSPAKDSTPTPTPTAKVTSTQSPDKKLSKERPKDDVCQVLSVADMEALLDGHPVDKYEVEGNSGLGGVAASCTIYGGVDESKTQHFAEYIGDVSLSCGDEAIVDTTYSVFMPGAEPLPGGKHGAMSVNGKGVVGFVKVLPKGSTKGCLLQVMAARPGGSTLAEALNHAYDETVKLLG